MESVRIGGATLARNISLNLAGQVLPAAVAVAAIPPLLARLGSARFGILSLAWVLLGYLTYLDLGLGRATTRFVADARGRGDVAGVRPAFWTSLAMQFAFGLVAGALIWTAAPFLATHAFSIPLRLQVEAAGVIRVLAIILPIQICSLSARGVLEASQRFGVVNLVKTFSNASLVGVPLVAAAAGLDLVGMVGLIAAGLLATGAVYGALGIVLVPGLRGGPRLSASMARPLLAYGGWVATSSALVAAIVYLDRLILSIVRSVSLLPFYSVPYDLAARLQVLPSSFVGVLFPAVATEAVHGRERTVPLIAASLRWLFILLMPLTIALVFLARPLLTLWLGRNFAGQSALPLQLIAIALLISSFSQVFAYVIDGLGRPALRTGIFLSYLPFYALIAWFIIARAGVTGAAIALLIRCCLDAILLGAGALWLLRPSRPRTFRAWWLPMVLGGGSTAVALYVGAGFVSWAGWRIVIVALSLVLLTLAEWCWMVSAVERNAILSVLRVRNARQAAGDDLRVSVDAP